MRFYSEFLTIVKNTSVKGSFLVGPLIIYQCSIKIGIENTTKRGCIQLIDALITEENQGLLYLFETGVNGSFTHRDFGNRGLVVPNLFYSARETGNTNDFTIEFSVIYDTFDVRREQNIVKI